MRKPHTKSRLGCRTCKRRKIKCDELTPECGNCVRFGVPCDFASASSHTSPSAQRSPAVSTPIRRGRPRSDWASWAEQIRVSSLPQTGTLSRCDCSPPRPNVVNMELFHHFLMHTAQTIDDSPESLFWREAVPELGFQHPCILDLMLALSSCHLARKKPIEAARYLDLAERHSTTALEAATVLIQRLDRENCPALYITAVLICFTSFAKGPSPGNMLLVATDRQVPWLSLIRGVKFVVETMGWGSIFSGVLAKHHPKPPKDRRDSPVASPPALNLVQPPAWQVSLTKISEMITVLPDPQCRQVYQREVEALLRCFRGTFGQGKPIGTLPIVMSWMYQVQDAYVQRLDERNPLALLILGHFCVLLRTVEGMYWFIQGWPRHVVDEILKVLDLQCHQWLAWPVEFLNREGHTADIV